MMAPVLIPTLCRFEHFKQCVKSLSTCKGADQTELIIGLDYPSKEGHWAGYEKIKNWIPRIVGFKKVTVLKRDENFGPVKNIIELYEYGRQFYNKMIITEDDNIFAPTFLQFMNSSLDCFEADPKISSICGYTHEKQYDKKKDYILSSDSCGWGFGLWVDKREKFESTHDENYYYKVLSSYRKSLKIFMKYPALLDMLITMVEKNLHWGDTRKTVANIIENTYQVIPSVSLVRNMGHDGTGTNCGIIENDPFCQQKLSDRKNYTITKKSSFKKGTFRGLFVQGLPRGKRSRIKTLVRILRKYILYRNLYVQNEE